MMMMMMIVGEGGRRSIRVLVARAAIGAMKELFREADVAAHATDGRVIDHGRSLRHERV